MPYTADATNLTQPADTGVLAGTAASEFRTLKTYIASVILASIALKAPLDSPVFTTQLDMTKFSTDNVPIYLRTYKSRGTSGVPTTVVTGDLLMGQIIYGYDGTANRHAASFYAAADGVPATNTVPGKLVFSTTPPGVSLTPVDRVTISASGILNVGTYTNPFTNSKVNIVDNAGARTFTNNLSDIGTVVLNGSAAAGQLAVGFSGGGGGGVAVSLGRGSSWDTDIKFYTNIISNAVAGGMSERMVITPAGNVGINAAALNTSPALNRIPQLVTENSGAHGGIACYTYSVTTGHGGMLVLGRSNNATKGVLTATVSGNALGYIAAEGVNTSAALVTGGYALFAQDSTGGVTNIPTSFSVWLATAAAGASQKFLIDSSANATMYGTLAIPDTVTITKNVAGLFTGVSINNVNAGVTATAGVAVNNGTVLGNYSVLGTGYTTNGVLGANKSGIYSNSAAGLYVASDNAAGSITFGVGTNQPERMRLDSTGQLGVGVTPSARNNTRLQIVDGIGFPATQVASSDVNTLDDYEEGTWTPTLSAVGSTFNYGTQVGTYTKVGNLVTVKGTIGLQVSGNTLAANAMTITGLPFGVKSTANANPVGKTFWFALTTALIDLTVVGSPGSTALTLYKMTAAAIDSRVSILATDLHATNASQISFSLTYHTA